MSHTINSCLVVSDPVRSFPNGEMTARGNVEYFSNKGFSKADPVKVKDVSVTNSNGVIFGQFREAISVETLRAIAEGLIQIADDAEAAMIRMEGLNKLDITNKKS
jgi:hypothetical protein